MSDREAQFCIGTTRHFQFGKKGGITSQTLYSQEKGYGFIKPVHISLTDGEDYVAGNNWRHEEESGAVSYEYPVFAVDVPVGVYEVKLVQGTNGQEPAVNGAYIEGNRYAVRWSRENFSVSFNEPAEGSWIWNAAGESKTTVVETAVADGQLTIELAAWIRESGESGTTYIKELSITRKQHITEPSDQPTLRFIGDSTLAKYPPEDGQVWTPIPERTGWGEDFSMGKFVDQDVVLVNRAVAGSSLKSYLYEGFYNDFFLHSHPGDTVILESGINDSAAGRRFSDVQEFEHRLGYLIRSCQAFGLDVVISSGTSSAQCYIERMQKLAAEYGLPFINLKEKWDAYLKQLGITMKDVTVDGTHLNKVGGVLAAQLVAGELAELKGLSVSGHVRKLQPGLVAPTVTVSGLHVKQQTQDSITLAWNMKEEDLYRPGQLITAFHVYRKKQTGMLCQEDSRVLDWHQDYELAAVQPAYVAVGMEGPMMQATLAVEDAPISGGMISGYLVACKGLTGEGPASEVLEAAPYQPSAGERLKGLVDKLHTQLFDSFPYTESSYAAFLKALKNAESLLAENPMEKTMKEGQKIKACEDDKLSDAGAKALENAITVLEKARTGLTAKGRFLEWNDFQTEAPGEAPWGVEGQHSNLMSCVMEEDGNRLLKLYVEAAGPRYVYKTFRGAKKLRTSVMEIKFVWYPGQPDVRNCTELEFYSSERNRVFSLKTSHNGHIGYVTGNYPDDNRYLIGDGFHAYEGSQAVDLGLYNEAWYDVRLVLRFEAAAADLYIKPHCGGIHGKAYEAAAACEASKKQAADERAITGIPIYADVPTITKMNVLLKRGRMDGDTGNDLSILWSTYLDDFSVYYELCPARVDFSGEQAVNGAYALEKGYGFYDYTYQKQAEGWRDGIYHARRLEKQPGTQWLDPNHSGVDYLAVRSQVWTELPQGDVREEDCVVYENTSAFCMDLPDDNYLIRVLFYNPGPKTMHVVVRAGEMKRYDSGSHGTPQIGQTVLAAGETRAVSFPLAVFEGQLNLRFEQEEVISAGRDKEVGPEVMGELPKHVVYVKSVAAEPYRTEERSKKAIFLTADSTVQTYANADTGRGGWGQCLHTLFGDLNRDTMVETNQGYACYETEQVAVYNYAKDGRSARSFLEEGRLNEVLLKLRPGDYVFLQFAHNDDNRARVNRYLTTQEYQGYLERYNQAIIHRGGTLVLVTPIALNMWVNGLPDDRFDCYRKAMMEVADRCDLPLLDLMGASMELLVQLGQERVNELGMYMADNIHTRMEGARRYAGLIEKMLRASAHEKLKPLKKLMKEQKQ